MKIKNTLFYLTLLCSSVSYFSADNRPLSNERVPDPVEEVFTEIYQTNAWGSQETVSGTGSELNVTEKMRSEFSALIKQLGVTSIADAPCGDLNWMMHVDLGTCRYIGIDIVQEIIENNIKIFGGTKEFKHLNLLENIIEQVDLILCRDMLVHLTYEQIFIAMRNFKQSGSKYILMTTDVLKQKNSDLKSTGGWRNLNFEQPPFNFPKPLALIEDKPLESQYPGKCLGLWSLEDLNI